MRRLVIAALALAALTVFAASAADAKVLITIDKSTQRMTVEVDGVARWTWPVSTGRRGHATPVGSFQAFRLERDHFSREWDDAPMPHSIFFTKRGHAIHGSFETARLGSPASAGCVRLHPDNARELFTLVEQRGVLNATVVITGEEPRAAPAVARQAPRTLQQQAVPQQAPQQIAPQQAAPRPLPSRTARRPVQDEIEYVDPRTVRPLYRRPPPVYARPQPGYEHLPPPPPGYMYAPQPAPPAGYYYYYR